MTEDDKTQMPTDEHASPRKITLAGRLRGYFLAGILVVAPLTITVMVTFWFLRFIDKNVTAILPEYWYTGLYGGTTIPGLGILIALTFFVIVGWFATNFLGRFFVRLYEAILDRMPVIRNIYSALKQIFETVMAAQSDAFRDVIMMEYPRKGVWSIGFVTGVSKGEVQRLTNEETINVFVPTTPNPTSGYLLFVPKKEVHYLDMTVEEGVKLVVSGGIITPPDRAEKAKQAAEKKKKADAKRVKKTAKKSAPKTVKKN